MSIKVTTSSKVSMQETVQEIIKTLAFRCLTIEEANDVLCEVRKQLESVPVMNAYDLLYRDNLPR